MAYINNGVSNLAPLMNQTTAQCSANVINPPTTGTYGSVQTLNVGPDALTYGSSSAVLTTQAGVPVQNTWGAVGANALTTSGSNQTNGLLPLGPAQGNAQNGAARPCDQIPAVFALIYAELGQMLTYTYRI